ncbi:phage tail protein [uncultured Cohaesibacter sp.]|uniref:phage tail protein n=1 Tax=uncultured Cohaesibacter sp. TaxID=1002546 RepID=UPI002AAC2A42|nr:phage tail protein [uncultured Cohaesibacter sp.]
MRPLAALGSFVFSPDVGSYEEFQRRWRFSWAKPDPIGSAPLKQWTGKGDQTIRISGGIWPEIQPTGAWKIEALAAVAGLGSPMSFVLGNGLVLGRWCVESISKRESEFQSSRPSEIKFDIEMSKYSGGGLWAF